MAKSTKYRIELLLKSFKKDEFSIEESVEYIVDIYKDSKILNRFNLTVGFIVGAILGMICMYHALI